MAVQTGRTTGKWIKVQMDDSAGTMRDIPVSTIGGIGVVYDQVELTALQDVMHGFLPGHGTVGFQITGPFDTTAAQAASGTGVAPALSGSHTVIEPNNGGNAPRGFAVYFGMQHLWETGEPVFGLAEDGTNGVLVSDWMVNDDGTYSATIMMAPGSAIMAWGTAAIT